MEKLSRQPIDILPNLKANFAQFIPRRSRFSDHLPHRPSAGSLVRTGYQGKGDAVPDGPHQRCAVWVATMTSGPRRASGGANADKIRRRASMPAGRGRPGHVNNIERLGPASRFPLFNGQTAKAGRGDEEVRAEDFPPLAGRGRGRGVVVKCLIFAALSSPSSPIPALRADLSPLAGTGRVRQHRVIRHQIPLLPFPSPRP